MSLFLSVITALNFICIAFADDRPLQDLCVADLSSKTVRVNGWPCKDPRTVTVNDFVYRGINLPGNSFGGPTAFKPVNVETFPGLNTQGLSMLRFDLSSNASDITPHTHPRAAELIFVTQGSVEAGFVSGSQRFNVKLKVGDVFVFPYALVHYFRNIGNTKSVVMAVFNSQNPGYAAVPPKIYGD